jgi:hypothetical protein
LALHLGELYSSVKQKCNDGIELAAGERGLNNVVRWMHMVEGVEISHFSEENEIAFTTGIALNGNKELFDLVKVVYKRNVSGIVMNVGPYIKEIPTEIIKFCNQKSLPLFRVPWNVKMARIMKAFAEEIALSHKRDVELVSAVKNAVYYSDNYNLYAAALEKYGYDENRSYCMAVCEYTDKKGGAVEAALLEGIKIYTENTVAALLDSAEVFRVENQIWIFFCDAEEKSIASIMNLVIERLPCEIKEKNCVYVGIGKNVEGMRCISKTFNMASRIVKLQRRRMADGTSASYSNLGISRLFLTMENVDDLREFYGEVLEPLVKYDEKNNTDFVEFLKVYFSHGGHVRETAEKMYLHRNSINYKLRKIEEILDCNLSDINNKAQVLIALKLMELL